MSHFFVLLRQTPISENYKNLRDFRGELVHKFLLFKATSTSFKFSTLQTEHSLCNFVITSQTKRKKWHISDFFKSILWLSFSIQWLSKTSMILPQSSEWFLLSELWRLLVQKPFTMVVEISACHSTFMPYSKISPVVKHRTSPYSVKPSKCIYKHLASQTMK